MHTFYLGMLCLVWIHLLLALFFSSGFMLFLCFFLLCLDILSFLMGLVLLDLFLLVSRPEFLILLIQIFSLLFHRFFNLFVARDFLLFTLVGRFLYWICLKNFLSLDTLVFVQVVGKVSLLNQNCWLNLYSRWLIKEHDDELLYHFLVSWGYLLVSNLIIQNLFLYYLKHFYQILKHFNQKIYASLFIQEWFLFYFI